MLPKLTRYDSGMESVTDKLPELTSLTLSQLQYMHQITDTAILSLLRRETVAWC